MLTDEDLMGLAEWLKKYGQITAYTIAVITLTVFLVRFDTKSAEANRSLAEINDRVSILSSKVDALQAINQDREKYERWLRQANARLKRLYNARGWDYEGIE